ncbi:MAG TPA: hypothetical protein VFV87_08355 [Pirellulaceae bacterium]|nr:hypothetical protein [Pirellulaceae bacterium]
MSRAKFLIGCVVVAVTLVSMVRADDPASIEPGDQAPGVVMGVDRDRIDGIPIHFILNPDVRRPAGYPAEIPLEKLEAFLNTQRVTALGCGGMTWEGASCGMSSHTYASSKTPWLIDDVNISADFAETKTGTFLASFVLGRNRYGRADRKNDKLVWEKTYEPEYQQRANYRVLFGNDPAQRKALLARISESFKNLDVTQFPAKRRESLALQLKPCEDDSDPAVAALAKELRKALSSDLQR